MTGVARASLLAALVAPCVACDQVTKSLAKQMLEPGRWIELQGGLVRLQLAENPGGFLSLGAGLPESIRLGIFLVGVPLLLMGTVAALVRSVTLPTSAICGIAMILGGGAGNLLDRAFNDGAVVDFVSIGVGGLRTGIFNVADVAIVFGAILFAWSLRERSRPAPSGG